MAVIVTQTASANSAVYVIASSDGGEFCFEGDGAYWNWDIDVEGWDLANVDLTNHWDYATSSVTYRNIGDGEIHLKVSDRGFDDEWYYYDWGIIKYDGNGIHTPTIAGSGGRSVNVSGSPNVTTYIEQVIDIRKAQFLFDTSHSSADLTVVVHNGHLLENATVTLMNGAREVQWTDEVGEAEFSPHTGNYAMIVEHENFSSMLVDDLYFEADKSYQIRVNLTQCKSSSGEALCAADADDLIVYYKQKEPNMGPISPQGYVDYFADQLRTCQADENKCAVDSLERMCTQWSIFPKDLNVLLCNCEFTYISENIYNVEYTVKNFQEYPCEYGVTLHAGNKTLMIGKGTLPATWSVESKKSNNVTVNIEGAPNRMFLGIESEQI